MSDRKRASDEPIPKAKDQFQEDEDGELGRFLNDWDLPHGHDVAGGVDGNGEGGGGNGGFHGDPNTIRTGFGSPWSSSRDPFFRPINTSDSPFPYPTPSPSDGDPDGTTYPTVSNAAPTTVPENYDTSSSDMSKIPYSPSTSGPINVCVTTTDYMGNTITVTVDIATATVTDDSITVTTIDADLPYSITGIASDIAATSGPSFPAHAASDRPHYTPPPSGASRLRDILLGVFLGAGLVLFLIACFFGYRIYKKKKRSRGRSLSGPGSESGNTEHSPEMQSQGISTLVMPSLATDAAPPFSNHNAINTTFPHIDSNYISPLASPNDELIIINPFSDPTYNSSSGIEDYIASHRIPLGREPENPFIHPDDQGMDIVDVPRPNSLGDFPPEYTTVDGNYLDGRPREERFPFGDEALSLRTRSDSASTRREGSTSVLEYNYDDPQGVADGFRYNPADSGRFPR